MSPIIVTVSQVNRRLAMMTKNDSALRDICIKGEISNFVDHYKTGHMYFSLKDDECSIKAVMFKTYADGLSFMPENGMKVIVRGSVQLYEREGACQIYASEITPDGVGEMYVAFEQLKKKLETDGLFSQKRLLPPVPSKICVVSSETGAVINDIINVLNRRYPLVRLILVPALVQGADAPDSIVKAVEKAQKTGADVLIIARGGGSAEDLQAFNTEKVARAIYDSEIPTISAVGHETDYTISDFVADLRAPTPSAAAELAVPDIEIIRQQINYLKTKLYDTVAGKLNSAAELTSGVFAEINKNTPAEKLRLNRARTDEVFSRLKSNCLRVIINKEAVLRNSYGVVTALSPTKTLERGYSIVNRNNAVISDISLLNIGDSVDIQMKNGSFRAVVEEIENDV